MARAITTAAKNELSKRQVQMALLTELQFDSGTDRMWTGHGDLILDADGDSSDETFVGVGAHGRVSPIAETQDIRAEGVEMSLVGMDHDSLEHLSDALTEHVQGRTAKLWLLFLTEEMQPIMDPLLLMKGRMDTLSIDEDPNQLAVRLTVENQLIDLQIANESRLTAKDQQQDFSNDKGLDFMGDIQDKTVAWGAPTDQNPGKEGSRKPRPAEPRRGLPRRPFPDPTSGRGRRGLPPRGDDFEPNSPRGLP